MRRRLGTLAALAACAVAVGCGRSAPVQNTPDIDHVAAEYVDLVAALTARDPDSASGDTAVSRPAEAGRHDSTRVTGADVASGFSRTSLGLSAIAAQAQDAIDTLRTSHAAAAEPERRDWLLGQLLAVQTRASVQSGTHLPFDKEVPRLFGIELPPSNADDLADVRTELNAALPGTGPAASRLAQFDMRVTVPPERLPEVFTRALAECRARTKTRQTLPADERVDVSFVRGEPWSAFSTYLGSNRSRIDVNTAFPLTVDRVLDLACHEGYPGHHVINLTRDARARAGRPELSAVPLFSPESFAAEARASNASALVFSDDERAAFERSVLFPLAGLDVALAARHVRVARLLDRLAPAIGSALTRYLTGTRDFIEAGWDLQDQALMAHPQATLLFANQFRGFALAYTWEKKAIGTESGSRRCDASRTPRGGTRTRR